MPSKACLVKSFDPSRLWVTAPDRIPRTDSNSPFPRQTKGGSSRSPIWANFSLLRTSRGLSPAPRDVRLSNGRSASGQEGICLETSMPAWRAHSTLLSPVCVTYYPPCLGVHWRRFTASWPKVRSRFGPSFRKAQTGQPRLEPGTDYSEPGQPEVQL